MVGFTYRVPIYFPSTADPRPTCTFTDLAHAVSGHLVTFRCHVIAIKPTPSITWFKEGRQDIPPPKTVITLSGDQYSFDVTTSLTFAPVREDDGMTLSVAMESPAWVGSRKLSTSLDVKCENLKIKIKIKTRHLE